MVIIGKLAASVVRNLKAANDNREEKKAEAEAKASRRRKDSLTAVGGAKSVIGSPHGLRCHDKQS